MRIALIGGTGLLGRALALGWAPRHQVMIGSRDRARAEQGARRCARQLRSKGLSAEVGYGSNEEVASRCDLLVLSVPSSVDERLLRALNEAVPPGAICLSPVAPFTRDSCYLPAEGPSFAEKLARLMTRARVVAGLHTFPAGRFLREGSVEGDVPLASDDEAALAAVEGLISELPSLRAVRAGPLAAARLLEALTPLLLNVASFARIRAPTLKFL